jgi:hypothetical protein
MERLSENCTEIQSLLPLWVGSDLEPLELEAVRTHLKECGDCKGLAQRGQAAREVFVTLRTEDEETSDATPALWQGVRAQLLKEGLLGPAGADSAQRELAPAGPGISLLGSPRVWWSAAAAAAAVVVTLGVTRLLEPSTLIQHAEPGASVAATQALPSPGIVSAPAAGTVTPLALRRAADGEEHMIDQAATYRGWNVSGPVRQGTGDGTSLVGGQPQPQPVAPPVLRRRRIR